MRGLILAALLASAAGCTFDGSGVSGDDDVSSDSDGDGVLDAADNCPDDANAGQEDEDGDGVGNVCDNCPSVDNEDQASTDGDEVGDACDPEPSVAGNEILFFEGFDDPDALDTWRTVGGGAWSVSDGAAAQTASAGDVPTVYLPVSFRRAVVDTRATLDVVPPSSPPADPGRGFAMIEGFSSSPGLGAGYYCYVWMNATMPSTSSSVFLFTLHGSQPYDVEDSAALGAALANGQVFDMRQSMDGDSDAITCAASGAEVLTGSDNTYDAGFVALRTHFIAAHFDFVVVYSLAP